MANELGYIPNKSYNVAVAGSSASSSAFTLACTLVRLCADTDVWIMIADAPTASATDSVLLPASCPEYFQVRPGQKVAVLQKATAGTLNITEMAR